MKIDNSALVAIREYFDIQLYSLIDLRMSLELEPSLTGFPKFESLQRVVKRLDPAHETMFRLLRLGEVVDDDSFRAAFPHEIASALVSTELVVATEAGWRTPGLLLVPAEGLLLITGTPSSYPTADRFPRAWFDLSTFFVARTLPYSLAGRRVLDICSGTGVQALLCAARGASAALGVELHADAVVIARANAVLNGFQDRVEFRQSDMLTGLPPEDRFEFVVANLPYAPVIAGNTCPATVTEIGNNVLWPLLDQLPAHLAESAQGIVGTWRSIGYRGSTYQLRAITDRLAAQGCAVSAYIDPAFDTVEDVLRLLRKDLSQRPGIESQAPDALVEQVGQLITDSALPLDGFYNQVIRFGREPGQTPPAEPVVFELARPGMSKRGGA